MMILFANDIRQVLWFAVVPALITVFLIVFGIEDPEGMSARPFPFADSAGCAQANFRRLLARGGHRGDLHARPIQ